MSNSETKPWYPDDSGEWVDVEDDQKPDHLADDDVVEVLIKRERDLRDYRPYQHLASSAPWENVVAYKLIRKAAEKPWYPDDSGQWVEVVNGQRPDELADDDVIEVLAKVEREEHAFRASPKCTAFWSWPHMVAYKLIRKAAEKPEPTKAEKPEPTKAVNAVDLLDKAAGHMRDRAATYDKPEGERSMARTVAVFNVHHDTNLTEAQGWHLLQILKDVRLFQRDGYHADSAEDCVAYAALKGEAKARESGNAKEN